MEKHQQEEQYRVLLDTRIYLSFAFLLPLACILAGWSGVSFAIRLGSASISFLFILLSPFMAACAIWSLYITVKKRSWKLFAAGLLNIGFLFWQAMEILC